MASSWLNGLAGATGRGWNERDSWRGIFVKGDFRRGCTKNGKNKESTGEPKQFNCLAGWTFGVGFLVPSAVRQSRYIAYHTSHISAANDNE